MTDLHEKALLLVSFKIGFPTIIRGTNVPTSWIWYANLFAKPPGRCQPCGRNSKIGYKVVNCWLSPPRRREPAAAGPPILAAVTTSGRPDNRIQSIHGPIGCRSEIFFPHSARRGLKGTPAMYSKVRNNAGGGGQPFRWGSSYTGKSFWVQPLRLDKQIWRKVKET